MFAANKEAKKKIFLCHMGLPRLFLQELVCIDSPPLFTIKDTTLSAFGAPSGFSGIALT